MLVVRNSAVLLKRKMSNHADMTKETKTTLTKFGSPVETNLPESQHNSLVKILEYCEEQVLKQTNGKTTLTDVLSGDQNTSLERLRDALKKSKIDDKLSNNLLS